MNTYEIVPLPKEEWKGTPVPMRYTTEGYFDVEIREDADSFHVDMVKKLFDKPVLHNPDFSDGLYADYWPGAEAWGIIGEEPVEACEGANVSDEKSAADGEKPAPKKKLLACIECCPEEWSNRLLVTEVWVADELHRQGIATRMMNLVKEKAMRDGRRAIMLETQSCNLHAIAFYKSQGFRLMGIDSCCYGNFDIARHEVRINLVYYIRPDVVRAEKKDLKEILDLQYLAYQSEAALFGNKDIPPLKETLPELEEEFKNGIVLKMVSEDGRIIGSVRSYAKDKTAYIGKLMVHPDFRGKGYGSKLLREIERYYVDTRYELFTSTRSVDNIRLYEKLGYKIFDEKKITDELVFVYMEKMPV